jgi:hypothetical protein
MLQKLAHRFLGRSLKGFQCLRTTRTCQHLVAEPYEHMLRQADERCFIVGEENAPLSSRKRFLHALIDSDPGPGRRLEVHGGFGITAEIHEYLVHLRRISQDSARRRVEVWADIEGRGQRRPQQAQGVLHNAVQLDGLPFGLAPATEGKNLLHQVSGALPGRKGTLAPALTAPQRVKSYVCEPRTSGMASLIKDLVTR